MTWVTWRQHRLMLAGVAAMLGTATLYLLITGRQMHDAYASVAACHPSGSHICSQVATNFLSTYAPVVGATAALLNAAPALIGAFAGAPLLSREFETGTFRYAWTQGFGRTRWTVAKIVPLAIALSLAAGAFSLLFSWYLAPILGAGDNNGPLDPVAFDLGEVTLALWTLAAFAIGTLAGVLIRRVIPAMFATIAAWTGLVFATALYLRPHYSTPVLTTKPKIPAQAWVLSQGWFKGGKPATLAMINDSLARVDVRAVTPNLFQPGPATPANFGDPVAYLIRHGYIQLTSYQPASQPAGRPVLAIPVD
jgi:ABC-type transport system involved in multi-copper enzyme maturation permease subunit